MKSIICSLSSLGFFLLCACTALPSEIPVTRPSSSLTQTALNNQPSVPSNPSPIFPIPSTVVSNQSPTPVHPTGSVNLVLSQPSQGPLPSASASSTPSPIVLPSATAYPTYGSSGGGGGENTLSVPVLTLPAESPGSNPDTSPTLSPEPIINPTSSPTPVSITPHLRASRLSGPAPLAVMFDATNTSSSRESLDPFHQLHYAFNFGDPSSGNWALSGLSKNTQAGGPLSAHVFETPGTYTVRLEVSHPDGERMSTSIEITVENPDNYWSGNRTICVSPGSDFTACPTGSAQQTTLPSVYEDRRVLLHRGETFGAIQIPVASDNLLVGAYGSGAKPRVPRVRIGFGRPQTADFTDEITIMDLEIAGEQDGIHHQGSGSRILLLRNDLTRQEPAANNNITIGGALNYYAASDPNRVVPTESFYWPREIFIVENHLVGSTENDSLPHLNMACLGAQYAFMGNDASYADEHTIRTFALYKSVFAHNALRGHFNDARHALKFHSAGVGVYGDSYTHAAWASRYAVLANNIFGDTTSNGDWTITLSPQNVTSAEGLEDLIVENNQFVRGPATRRDIQMAGRRISVRGNTSLNANNILTQAGPIVAYGAPDTDTYYGALPAEWKGPYFIQPFQP